jgi:protein arginine N-methyltransferase 8
VVQRDRVYYRLRTHLEMLNDRVRGLAYQRAIEATVRDRIVLDVGCGSGILSLFAARAGARQVLAVDMDVPPGAEEVARRNGLEERIQFFSGRVQDIDLPVDRVEVIVSEWMGGLLLMEDMLPAVLYARDRWLKPGGILLPDRAQLFLAPLDDVAGVDSHRFPGLRQTISTQMWVSVIDPSRFLAEPACILDLDLYAVREPGVKAYETGFRFGLNRAGMLNGFGLWFEVVFNEAGSRPVLSTAPWLPPTHWAQALWVLPLDIDVGPGDEVWGTFAQTGVVPSTASFRADVKVGGDSQEKAAFSQAIEADPANMNAPGRDEERIAQQAASGAFQGCHCLWIGCSMSMAALMVARNGAASLSILNHSPWAARAMHQVAHQEGLTNIRFLSALPGPGVLRHRQLRLLGSADSSWQALLSHIGVRRALGRATFRLRLDRRDNPWQQFYGFDFSAFAPHDLEMIHEDRPLANGLELIDVTHRAGASGPTPAEGEIVYRGVVSAAAGNALHPADGLFNCARVDFSCGTVVLPLPTSPAAGAPRARPPQRVELTISLPDPALCRFSLDLSGPDWSLRQHYEQPLTAMGHIVHNHQKTTIPDVNQRQPIIGDE